MNDLRFSSGYLAADRVDSFQAKLAKINERLAEANCPRISVDISAPSVCTVAQHGIPGLRINACKVTINRSIEASLGQVRLLGKTEVDPSSQFMTHTFYQEINDEQRNAFEHPIHTCHCDHCGTNRKRSTLYIFETGKGLLRVGNGCADEFAGLPVRKWLKSFQDAVELLEDNAQLSLSESRELSILDVDLFLKQAVVVINTFGYHNAAEHGANATGALTYDTLMAKVDEYGQVSEVFPPEVEQKVREIKLFIRESEQRPEDRNKDYFVNLRNMVDFGHITGRQANHLASSVVYFEHHAERLERQRQRQADAKVVGEATIGTIGTKQVFKNLKLVYLRTEFGQFGSTTMYSFMDEEKRLLSWKRTGHFEHERGDVFHLYGAIKDHRKFYSKTYEKDVISTELTRCSVLTLEEALEKEKEGPKAVKSKAKKKAELEPAM